MGARGGGASRRRRRSRGGGSPEMAELGPPGVKTTLLWVYDGLRGMRDPPMACAGLGKARGGGFDGGGSSARRRLPERTRWAALGLGSGRKRMAGAWGTYRGSKSSKAAVQGRWRRRRVARAVRCPWTSRCRGPLGLLAPREASGSSCEAGGGVREVGIAPATLNFTGGALTGG